MLRLLKFDVFSHSMWLSVFSRLCPNIKNQKHVVGFPKRVCLCDLWCNFFFFVRFELSRFTSQIRIKFQECAATVVFHTCA